MIPALGLSSLCLDAPLTAIGANHPRRLSIKDKIVVQWRAPYTVMGESLDSSLRTSEKAGWFPDKVCPQKDYKEIGKRRRFLLKFQVNLVKIGLSCHEAREFFLELNRA
jgi:hypothetical protein